MWGACWFLITLVLTSGCAVGGPETLSSTESESFEEFRDSTYRETWTGGLYIVDGDTPIVDDKALSAAPPSQLRIV